MNEQQHDSVLDAGVDLEAAMCSVEEAIEGLEKAIRNFRAAGLDMNERIRYNIINNLRACMGDGDLANTVTIQDMLEKVDEISEG